LPSYALTMPFRPALDGNAVPIAGAKAVLTLTGTTTLAPVYTTSALSVEAANPVVANAAGRFGRVYLDDAVTYRLRIFDAGADIANDTPIEDFDPYDPQEVGAQGVQGTAGTNATVLEIGTVSTLAPGASATAAVNDEGSGLYSLDLGIPAGAAGSSGALSNGDYGDITVSGDGATLTVDAAAITLAKMANLAENAVIGRQSAGTGVPEAVAIGASAASDILDRAAGDGRYIQRTESLEHSIFIPASAMVAQTTNGAAAGTAETATNDIMVSTLDFDQSTIEYAQFQIAMPKSWDEGTVTAQFLWSSTATGNVVWGLQGVAISNDDVLDAAFGTAQTVTDGVTATTDLMVSAATSAITIGGSPASEDLVVFRPYRNASSGSDTVAADAKLIGVRLNFTTNAADDS
jgi:hypothetical protein